MPIEEEFHQTELEKAQEFYDLLESLREKYGPRKIKIDDGPNDEAITTHNR